jgi:hypothetical protein
LVEPAVNANNSLTGSYLAVFISAVTVGYLTAATWVWSISPLNAQVSNVWLFGAGYAPVLLIIIVYGILGHFQTNDDKALVMQRQHRERTSAIALGVTHSAQKPSWWSKMSGSRHSDLTRFHHHTSDIGGGPATMRKIDEALEMKALRNELLDDEAGGRILDGKGKPAYFVRGSTMLRPDTPPSGAKRRGSLTESSDGSEPSTRLLQAKPQVVRSMLDV